jgi:hypothetical protein
MILSLVVLQHMSGAIRGYVTTSQCGFREGRSTIDAAWAYAWLKAMAWKYNRTIHSILVATTALRITLQGFVSDEFQTVMGIPQGDGLSPVLFIIYLEAKCARYVS